MRKLLGLQFELTPSTPWFLFGVTFCSDTTGSSLAIHLGKRSLNIS
jgi:hypothetical protein